MANYVLIYSGGSMTETDAERQAVMAAWGEWFGALGAAVVDGGNPFGPSASIAPDGTVSTGTVSGASGYSVIRADSLEAAVTLATGCPHLQANGTIEVYETFEVM